MMQLASLPTPGLTDLEEVQFMEIDCQGVASIKWLGTTDVLDGVRGQASEG